VLGCSGTVASGQKSTQTSLTRADADFRTTHERTKTYNFAPASEYLKDYVLLSSSRRKGADAVDRQRMTLKRKRSACSCKGASRSDFSPASPLGKSLLQGTCRDPASSLALALFLSVFFAFAICDHTSIRAPSPLFLIPFPSSDTSLWLALAQQLGH